jgi:hypothetical protein
MVANSTCPPATEPPLVEPPLEPPALATLETTPPLVPRVVLVPLLPVLEPPDVAGSGLDEPAAQAEIAKRSPHSRIKRLTPSS